MEFNEVEKAKHSEWVNHFLLESVNVEKEDGKFIVFTTEEYVHKSWPENECRYLSAEKAWNAALHIARDNPARFAAARMNAFKAMKFNNTDKNI